MRTKISYNNFVQGVISESLNGRYNLPLYRNGLSICNNFNLNYSGGLKYRTGLEYINTTEDSYYIPFIFNKEQSYLIQFTATSIFFLTYIGGKLDYVEDEGSVVELTNPYSLAESKEIRYAQNGDVMYIVHPDYVPQKLTRTSATTFTMEDVVYSPSSPFTVDTGYPASVSFYEKRLYYGGVKNKPTFLYGSDAGDYDTFTFSGTEDDLDGFKFDIAEISQAINWIKAGENSLILGTTEGIVSVNGGAQNESITKTNIFARKVIDEGAKESLPIKVDNSILFIDFTNRRTRYINYDIISESFKSPDLNLANLDLTIGGLKKLMNKKDTNNLFYVVKDNGEMLVASFIANENSNGWSRLKTP
ncbi:MAG: hypothetical protein ACOC1K_03300, partial [Nanoarchaeota archaeon]